MYIGEPLSWITVNILEKVVFQLCLLVCEIVRLGMLATTWRETCYKMKPRQGKRRERGKGLWYGVSQLQFLSL